MAGLRVVGIWDFDEEFGILFVGEIGGCGCKGDDGGGVATGVFID